MFNLIMTTQNIDGEKTKRFFDSLNAMTGDIKEKLFLYIINQDKRPVVSIRNSFIRIEYPGTYKIIVIYIFFDKL